MPSNHIDDIPQQNTIVHLHNLHSRQTIVDFNENGKQPLTNTMNGE